MSNFNNYKEAYEAGKSDGVNEIKLLEGKIPEILRIIEDCEAVEGSEYTKQWAMINSYIAIKEVLGVKANDD